MAHDRALAQHKFFGRRPQRLHILLVARFGVGPDYRFGSRKAIANPGAIVQNQLEAVGPDNAETTLRPLSSVGSAFNFSVNAAFCSAVKWKFSRTG